MMVIGSKIKCKDMELTFYLMAANIKDAGLMGKWMG